MVNPPMAIAPTPLPTKIVSTRLYNAVTIIPIVAGKDKFTKSLLIFSSPNRAVSCFINYSLFQFTIFSLKTIALGSGSLIFFIAYGVRH
jgi:hypothetical protein